MLKKEWRDIFLPVLLRLMVGPVLAVIQMVSEGKINEISVLLLFIGYAISVFWVALHLGLNAFHCEFRDHAFEYLLTFPFRRRQLLAVKFAVRFFVMGFLFILYFFLQNLLQWLSFLPPAKMQNSLLFNAWDFSLLALSFFIIGFFFSLVDWKSARPAIPLMVLVSHSLLGFFIVKLFRNLEHDVNGIAMSSILLVLSTGVFFIFTFRRLERGILGKGWSINSKRSALLVNNKKNGQNWGLLRHEWSLVLRSFMLQILLMFIQAFLLSMILVKGNGPKVLSDRATLYAILAGTLLLTFAFGSGNRLLHNEFRNKALEYMFTFPFSLRRVLLEKLLARIVVLVPAALVFMIYVGHFSDRISLQSGMFYMVLRPEFFPFWMALLLLNGFFLSFFEMKNIMALVSLANMYTIVLVPLALFRALKHFSVAIHAQILDVLIIGSGMLLTTLVLAAVFIRILPRFDLAAPGRYSRVFGLLIFIAFTAVSLVSLGILLFI